MALVGILYVVCITTFGLPPVRFFYLFLDIGMYDDELCFSCYNDFFFPFLIPDII